MNMIKVDSHSSGADQMEERQNKSSLNIEFREMDFKNSFLEWGVAQQPHQTRINDSQRFSTAQTPTVKNESKFTFNGNESSANAQFVRMNSRNSQALSEALNRNASLSLESNMDLVPNNRTCSNSSSSNHLLNRRKNPTKSKFYN